MRAFFRIVAGILITFVFFACAPATQVAKPDIAPIKPTSTAAGSGGSGISQPIPLATSRGDKLEASPPTSVKYGVGRPVLVEFFRFTWTTCQQMAPMVHGLEAKYFGKIDFFFLDADDPATRDYQGNLGFQYQPYFVLLDADGKEYKRWAGFVTQDEFETTFKDVLK